MEKDKIEVVIRPTVATGKPFYVTFEVTDHPYLAAHVLQQKVVDLLSYDDSVSNVKYGEEKK